MARSKYEKRAQEELEDKGYIVDWKIRPRIVPRTYQVDYFGLFDLIAYKEDEPLRWISIKAATSGSTTQNRKDIEKFKMPEGNQKEQWRYDRNPKNRRKIRVRKKIIK